MCRAIEADPAQANRFTWIGRTVAVCTNGTRVLGLGDIGLLAVDARHGGQGDLLHRRSPTSTRSRSSSHEKHPDAFVRTVLAIAPSFGAIHLEDIRVPECFEIEKRLIEALDVPVMHGDVHGTAVAALAAIMGACAQLGRPLERQTIGQIGLGAAGFGIARLAQQARAKAVLATDPDPLAQTHADANGIEIADFETVMARADIVVAATGRPGLIGSEMIREGQVVFALTNPEPEIEPQVALRAGAAFAADGASVNNVARLPGHLPRRPLLRRPDDLDRDEARRRAGDREAHASERARARPARPGRPPRGGHRCRRGGTGRGARPARPRPAGAHRCDDAPRPAQTPGTRPTTTTRPGRTSTPTASTPRSRACGSARAAAPRRRSTSPARCAASTAATPPSTTPSRSPAPSRASRTAASGCCAAASTRAPGCGRSPAGFVDLGESVEEAARREAHEELEIDVAITGLVGVYSRPQDRVVLVVYDATLTGEPRVTPEATEIRAFAPAELPWDELAFWSTAQALRDLLARA